MAFPNLCDRRETTYQRCHSEVIAKPPPDTNCNAPCYTRSVPRYLKTVDCDADRDAYTTTSGNVFDRKFYNHSYAQPENLKPIPCDKIAYVKPDWCNKISNRSFNPKPIYDRSVTKSDYALKQPISSFYGDPVPSDPVRSVYTTEKRKFVYEFDKHVPSAIRTAHPYLSAYAFFHRRFAPEELEAVRAMRDDNDKSDDSDVAIKLRVIPMEGPFEQNIRKASKLGSYDVQKECPGHANFAHLKHFFDTPMYQGCPPRTFPPVPGLGMASTTKSVYSWPYRAGNKDNRTTGVSMCAIQPVESFAGIRKIPNIYKTESQIYGSSRPVSAFLPIHEKTVWTTLANANLECS